MEQKHAELIKKKKKKVMQNIALALKNFFFLIISAK